MALRENITRRSPLKGSLSSQSRCLTAPVRIAISTSPPAGHSRCMSYWSTARRSDITELYPVWASAGTDISALSSCAVIMNRRHDTYLSHILVLGNSHRTRAHTALRTHGYCRRCNLTSIPTQPHVYPETMNPLFSGELEEMRNHLGSFSRCTAGIVSYGLRRVTALHTSLLS
ncbi:hypothetical protein BDW22DRAFT_383138 [Trametopsis cervina]|nr:hypothetical protein BDW22DRAFT_383138 [Trametopsis cervina]